VEEKERGEAQGKMLEWIPFKVGAEKNRSRTLAQNDCCIATSIAKSMVGKSKGTARNTESREKGFFTRTEALRCTRLNSGGEAEEQGGGGGGLNKYGKA